MSRAGDFVRLVDTDGATATVGDASAPASVAVAPLALRDRLDALDESPSRREFMRLFADTFAFVLDASGDDLLFFRELLRCSTRGTSAVESAGNLGISLRTWYRRWHAWKEKFPSVARGLSAYDVAAVAKSARDCGI